MEEIRRYLGIGRNNTDFDEDIREVSENCKRLMPKKAYAYFDLERTDSSGFEVRLKGTETVFSGKLAERTFSDCRGVVVILATLGMESEIAMKRTFAISAKKGLVLDAVFTAEIEKYLDEIEEEIKGGYGEITRRISCGYGDLSIELQKPLFNLLDGSRLGVVLNDCMMFVPNKSVMAIVGVK